MSVISFLPSSSSNDTDGIVEYKRSIDEIKKESEGIFSFVYYYRGYGNINPVYIYGLYIYMKICELLEKEGRFWNMILYTDENTLEKVDTFYSTFDFTNKKHRPDIHESFLFWQEIKKSNHVTFAVVHWKEYSPKKNMLFVEDTVMRIFRFRAFVDFPEQIVFVRDADTLFMEKIENGFPEEYIHLIKEWEMNVLEGQKKTGKPFLVGTSIHYGSDYHINRYTQMISQGAFAGFVNSLGNIPQFTNSSLWYEAIEYLRKGMKMVSPYGGTTLVIENEGTKYEIGKDEQILIFVFIRELLEETYFYNLAYPSMSYNGNERRKELVKEFTKQKNNKELKYVLDIDPDSVKYVFSNEGNPGFHSNCKEIFQDIFSTMENIQIYRNKKAKGENIANLQTRIIKSMRNRNISSTRKNEYYIKRFSEKNYYRKQYPYDGGYRRKTKKVRKTKRFLK